MRMKKKTNPSDRIQDNKPLTAGEKKKFILRLVAFLVFFALAITFITLGVTSLGHKEVGLQEITAPVDETVPLYQVGVSFYHYFTGSSNEIKLAVSQLSEIYAFALKDAYRMLDPENTYDNGSNLAALNQNRGLELTVPRELYETLQDAVRLTEKGEGYSLFNGALYKEWENLRYLLEPVGFDPLNDPEEADRLERLSAATGDLTNFSLEFLDDKACKLRFTVDKSYLSLLEELELSDVPILDLNVLTDAYKLRLVAARLEEKGYDRGYLSADNGLTLALSGYTDGGDYCFYGDHSGEAVPAATLPLRAGSCGVQLRAFGTREEPGYYAVEKDGQTYYRHPWLPADGSYREVLLSAFVSSEKLTAPEICFACLRLYTCPTDEMVKALAADLPASTALLLRSDPDTVYVTDAAIQPRTDFGFAASPVTE